MPEQLELLRVVLLIVVCFGVAVASLNFVARRSIGKIDQKTPVRETEVISFHLVGHRCVGANVNGRRIIDALGGPKTTREELTDLLIDIYPDAREAIQRREGIAGTIEARDGASKLSIVSGDGMQVVKISSAEQRPEEDIVVSFCLAALDQRSKLARIGTDEATFPIWREDHDGRVIWANAAYRRLETLVGFEPAEDGEVGNIFLRQSALPADRRNTRRVKLQLPGKSEANWFELAATPSRDGSTVFALPEDRLVQAERNLRDFVQTLTQTFAHLNVGLAIFNNRRELTIFNPALVELLGLTPEFLARRPTVFELFDALRENQTLPEPKDYKAWRAKISDLEATAKDRTYSETWSLVSGQTYRVTGRPHSEGAVAFLFEDISSEIMLERKFRADLQTTRSVFDGLNEAIAVFNAAGEMIMSNVAYHAFCGNSGERSQNLTFVEASRRWQDLSQPTPVWGDARDFASRIEDRSNWTGDVRLRDGRVLQCRFEALVGGNTLVGFRVTEAAIQSSSVQAKSPIPA